MNSSQSQLWMNVAPVKVPDVEIDTEILPFDHEGLRTLRRDHCGRYLFKRGREKRSNDNYEDIVHAVRLTDGDLTLGGESGSVNLQSYLSMAAALLREHFTAKFGKAKSRKLLGFNPLQVLVVEASDLVRDATDQEVPDWLSARVMLEIDVRVFNFDGVDPFVGIVASPRIRRRIARSCADWLDEGFDLHGFYVSKGIPGDDPRFEPRLRLCGRVVGVDGDDLLLTDCRDGCERMPAKEVELEAKFDAWRAVFQRVFGSAGESVRQRVEQRQSTLAGGKEKLARVQQTFEAIASKTLEVLPGVHFEVGEMLGESTSSIFPAVENCPPTLYVFDPAGNKRAERFAAVGLGNHGPFNQATQTPMKPRICVLCESQRRGEVEQFLQQFFNGAESSGKKNYFPKGFTELYRLKDPEWRCFPTEGRSAKDYHRAAMKALEAGQWDMAIVQLDESSHDFKGEENPYLVCKAAFLSQQTPVQVFETGTMRYAETNRQFALSDMALASYAKIGGVPWVLQVTKPYAHELVIGIGSATIRDSRLGEEQRVVGITTMFTNEGQYLLGNLSRAVPFEDYGQALTDMLITSVDEARTRLNWQKNEEVRLVFHSFKPLRDRETADAALAVAEHLTDFQVEIAFIHVAHDQPLTVFDQAQEGVFDWETKAKKGTYAPSRGQYLTLNGSESLLVLTGPKEVKRATDGLPSPLILRLHRGSAFRDLHYLTRQVYAFSCHSWRGFSGASMPVTILYSQLIARLLGRLETLPKWNPDALVGKMNRLRWFL